QPVPALSELRQPRNPIDLRLEQSLARRQAPGGENANAQPNGINGQTQPQSQTQRANSSPGAFYWDNSQGEVANEAYGQEANQPPSSSTPDNQQPSSSQPSGARQSGPRGSQSALAEQDTENREQFNPVPLRRTVVNVSVPEIDWSYAVIER